MIKELDPSLITKEGFIIPQSFQDHLNVLGLNLNIQERNSTEISILRAITKIPLKLDYSIKLGDLILHKTIDDPLTLFDLWLDGVFKVFEEELSEKSKDTLLGFSLVGEDLEKILATSNFEHQLLEFSLKEDRPSNPQL